MSLLHFDSSTLSPLLKQLRLRKGVQSVSLVGDVVYGPRSGNVLVLDPNGASRTITLPSAANSNGLVWLAHHGGSVAAETITVSTLAPLTLATLRPGDTVIFGCDGSTWFVASTASSSSYMAVTFEGAGPYSVAAQVGGRTYNRTGRPWTIVDVTLHREVAGASDSTTIDVNIDGVTAYTTQGNRPTVAFSEGANAVDVGAALPDVLTVAANSYLSMDIDAAEGGAPENLSVTVTVSY